MIWCCALWTARDSPPDWSWWLSKTACCRTVADSRAAAERTARSPDMKTLPGTSRAGFFYEQKRRLKPAGSAAAAKNRAADQAQADGHMAIAGALEGVAKGKVKLKPVGNQLAPEAHLKRGVLVLGVVHFRQQPVGAVKVELGAHAPAEFRPAGPGSLPVPGGERDPAGRSDVAWGESRRGQL